MTTDAWCGRSQAVGLRLQQQLRELQREYPSLVADIRGRGLMLGVDLRLDHVAETQTGMLAVMQQHGLLLYMVVSFLLNVEHIRIAPSFTHGNVLRIEPPLVADASLCDRLISALGRLLDVLQRGDAGTLLAHLMEESPASARPAIDGPKRRSPAQPPISSQERDAAPKRFAFNRASPGERRSAPLRLEPGNHSATRNWRA